MKMYILIKDDVKSYMAPVVSAHASLSCYLTYSNDPDMIEWANTSFKKVICKLNNKEFESAKDIDKSIIITESAVENKEMAIVLCPRKKYPKKVNYYKLYK